MTKLEILLDALNASPVTLTGDYLDFGCDTDYAIRGRFGHIYQDGDGFLVYFTVTEAGDRAPSSQRWNGAAKDKLSFCQVMQDGDWEGCLRLGRMRRPTRPS